MAGPYLVLAAFVIERHVTSVANERLDLAGANVAWGDGNLSWISRVYPPIPVGIAALVPGGAVSLALVGALAAGIILHTLAERLVTRGTPRWLTVLLLASVGATPLFGYLATESLSEFLGFAVFVMAMGGFLRFVVDEDTEGGFQAGLLLGLAAACNLTTVVFAGLLGVAAPFIAHARFRQDRGAGRAIAAVLAFPALATTLGWAFLEWRFGGTVLAAARAQVEALGDSGGVIGSLTSVARAALVVPLFFVGGVLLILRRGMAAIAYLLPVVGLVLSLWFGLRSPNGMSVVVLAALAILAVPARPSRQVSVVLGVMALAQIALTWTLLVGHLPLVSEWIDALVG